MSEKRNFLVLAAVVLFAFPAAALAQIAVDPNLVYVPVAVNGPKNVFVTGLKKESFKLLEDGIEQTIVSFHEEDQPIDIDIVLALGALQRGRATLDSTKIREALENFRQQSNPRNRYTIEEMPFGANGIFDAMSRHVTNLHASRSNARRVLLVLTDGFEESGGDPGRALQEYAKKLSIPIYIIYAAPNGPLTNDLFEVGRGRQIFLDAGAVYEDLTRFTGGRLYQAEADTQLRGAMEELAGELKNQYVLGFKSTNDARNDKWRKIEVKMTNPPQGMRERDLKPKVRDRYFVAKAE